MKSGFMTAINIECIALVQGRWAADKIEAA
jgi:hypothetical protein